MSSVVEQRNITVQQNIPKLIKALTGFNPKDENYKSCLQFCHSHFKYHRNLSVNIHEVKKDVDGMCEKLRFSNFHDVEKIFKKLVEESVSHELAANHYEKDVMYSILNLLITLAYDPIGNLKNSLREGKQVIQPRKIDLKKSEKKTSDNFISLLLKDNFSLSYHETDSELSEWTSSEDETEVYAGNSSSEESVDEDSCKLNDQKALRPPRKPEVFQTEIIENPEKWMRENIQNPWWKDERTVVNIPSEHVVANFCKVWQKHLSERSMGFIKPKNLSLVSEYCLLREIFWMFINPVECKFFKIEPNGEIKLKTDVTLPSLMPDSLQFFLSEILLSINLMKKLKLACKKSHENSISPHTFETYYKIMKSFLDRICQFVLEQEKIVREQKLVYTILVFHDKFHHHARFLEMLWSIHSTSILDEDEHQPHICASYLLANLNYHIRTSTEKNAKNLAIIFFVNCLKSYLNIFDMWWSEARFLDYRQEFLMEMVEEIDADIEITRPRLLAKSRDRSFDDDVAKKIVDDRIMNLMLGFANKASFTFEIINKMGRANEIRQFIEDETTMCDEFCEKVDEEIKKVSHNDAERHKEVKTSEKSTKNLKLIEDMKAEMMANGDEILLLALESTFEKLEKPTENLLQQPPEDHLEFYDFLNNCTDFLLLPVENLIENILRDLLSSKISISETFLKDIYFTELQTDKLIRDMRKVYFLACNEVVNLFDLKIFNEVDRGTSSSWANSYTLTTSLNDAISGMSFDNSHNFIVKVNKKSFYPSVIDAIDELSIQFNVDQYLGVVFTSSVIEKYNQVFRFLMKIKYSQLILNNLRFPDFFKNRLPYANYQLIDIVIKRLSITRFGILQKINYLYSHLMTMIDGASMILDEKLKSVKSVRELISLHESFIDSVFRNSLNSTENRVYQDVIIETLKLAKIVKDEWRNVDAFSALDDAGELDSASLCDLDKNAIEIEKAFGVCEYKLKMMFDNLD